MSHPTSCISRLHHYCSVILFYFETPLFLQGKKRAMADKSETETASKEVAGGTKGMPEEVDTPTQENPPSDSVEALAEPDGEQKKSEPSSGIKERQERFKALQARAVSFRYNVCFRSISC